jgi:group I intron endonuclease
MYKIYLITNKINGKVYVGKTRQTLSRRFRQHKTAAKNGVATYLANAIRKHGEASFCIERVDFAESDFEANFLEETHILKSGSNKRELGYNQTTGGWGWVPTKETIRRMSLAHKNKNVGELNVNYKKNATDGEINRLYTKELKTTREIAQIFGVEKTLVSYRLKKLGVPLRPPYRACFVTDDSIQSAYSNRENKTLRQLAQKLGCSRFFMTKRLKFLGLYKNASNNQSS